jgi:cytochrome c oxidase subunit 1
MAHATVHDPHLHHEVMHHDEVHGHHEETFVSKYIFSQDHKMIAKQFLFLGMMWAIVGAFFSILFRLQLAWPNETFPFLETILGKWAEGGKLNPTFYYSLITMHGTILVFFVLTAGLSGTFSNLLIPLQIGARDMASPFINMLSFWAFALSSVVMLASLFVQTGPASAGWTMYPPQSALPQATSGSGLGTDLWLISMALFIASVTFGGLNYVATVVNLRTKGMSFFRMPLTVWAFFFTAIIALLSFPALLASAVLLTFDRLLGTSFFMSDIYIGGEHLAYSGGSPILFQHLFWFLGHPEVYIIILPAMGLVSEVLSVNARKPIFGYKAMIFSILGITILSFIVWAHHMFVTGLNPFVGSIFVLFTLLIAVPSAIKVFNWITTIWRGNLRLTPAMLFAIGFVSLFISGGLTGIFLGNSTIDIQLHDTYFVVAHFHIVMGVAAFFGMFAGIYHWFPKMYGRYMNNTLGYIHFFVTIICSYMIFWPMHYMGMTGVPRRYFQFDAFPHFDKYQDINVFITVFALIGFAANLLFVFNYFYSMYKGRKVTEQNPWGANTLEWTTPINPGHGNWPGPLPVVYRWPYDYSKNGRDFIPQTEPYSEAEVKEMEKHGHHVM